MLLLLLSQPDSLLLRRTLTARAGSRGTLGTAMDQRIVAGTATEPLEFLLVLASDHRTGATGIAPTVRLSKAGGSFAAPAGAVAEVGNGWYRVAANATDASTVGPLILSVDATATTDPADVRFEVVPTAYTPPLARAAATYPLTFLLIDSADHLAGKAVFAPVGDLAPNSPRAVARVIVFDYMLSRST
jgi:hypothetical protein